MNSRNKYRILYLFLSFILISPIAFFILCPKCIRADGTILAILISPMLGAILLFFFFSKKIIGERHFTNKSPKFPKQFSSPIKRNFYSSLIIYLPLFVFLILLINDYILKEKSISTDLLIFSILFVFVTLLFDLRIGQTKYLIEGTILKKTNLFPWKRDEIDLADVIGYSSGRWLLILLHKDGHKLMSLSSWYFDFSELEEWAKFNLAGRNDEV